MKDTALYTILIAGTIVTLLVSAIADRPSASPTATVTAERVYSMEKTVVAARRMPAAESTASVAADSAANSKFTAVALAAP